MGTEERADHRAERALLTRARCGDEEALHGLLHRYASLVWSTCALVAADEAEAARYFASCWEAILRSLPSARPAPDLAGAILAVCGEQLADSVPEESLVRALGSARQLLAEDAVIVEAPPEALQPVAAALGERAEAFRRATESRRASQRRVVVVPAAVAVAVLAGAVGALLTGLRTTNPDFLARRVREQVIASDLVPRFQEVIVPPFEPVEREGPVLRLYGQVSLVLDEVANLPEDTTAEQLEPLQRRVESLDLPTFVAQEAEEARGADRLVLEQAGLILQEIVNL